MIVIFYRNRCNLNELQSQSTKLLRKHPSPTGIQQRVQGIWSILSQYYLFYIDAPEDHNFAELEFMLENERKKFKEAKDKLEHDLDNERKLRIEF
jgi:hypothetical protein